MKINAFIIRNKGEGMSNEITKKFADNLQDLISESKKSIKDLAEEIGIPSGSLSKYQNDNAEPGIENFTKIAKYFNVSTDFLLGLTDVKATDLDIRDISEKTGLSEKAINNIRIITETTQIGGLEAKNTNEIFKEIINALLESDSLSKVVLKTFILAVTRDVYRETFPSEEEYMQDEKMLEEYGIYKLEKEINKLINIPIREELKRKLENK